MKPVSLDRMAESRVAAAKRIDHVAIATLDADTAADWFIRNFSMAVVADDIVEAAGVRLVYLAPKDSGPDDATMIQLAEPVADGNIRDHIGNNGEGLHHICFAVDDVGSALEHIGQSLDTIFPGGRGRRTCFLDERLLGVPIELTDADLSDAGPA